MKDQQLIQRHTQIWRDNGKAFKVITGKATVEISAERNHLKIWSWNRPFAGEEQFSGADKPYDPLTWCKA